MENDSASIIIGILVFVVFGGLIGWLIVRHIKYTVAGTKAHIKAVKQAVGEAKEEIKIANERKSAGLGWTLPPAPEAKESVVVPKEEVVFGYNEEQMKIERKANAKKGIVAGIVLLVFAGACVLGGVLFGVNSKKIAAYPTAQAQVLKCTVVTRTDDDGDEYVDHYKIDFEYTVDGETCKETGRHSDKRLEGVITVYYNPDKPEKAYFEAQAQGEGNVFWYVVGGIVGLLGLGVILGEAKKKRKLDEES